jgi:WhiB family redox-sensing transcriptional regulator
VTTLQLTALLDTLVDELDETATCTDIPCRVNDAELWFAESPADVEHAKSLCHACPVRSACLAGALKRAEPWGVWGGELFIAGVVVPRKRPRGRPRKCAAAA